LFSPEKRIAMLYELSHNRFVLFASGPKGSYRGALRGAECRRYYDTLQVAFRLAQAIGLVKDRYFEIEDTLVKFKVSENLVKIRRVAMALDQLVQSKVMSLNGVTELSIGEIRNGKIIFNPRVLTKEMMVREIVECLKKIRGYGLSEDDIRRGVETSAVLDMVVPEERSGYFERIEQFFGNLGIYPLMIKSVSKDMACSEVLCGHKKEEAGVTGADDGRSLPFINDIIMNAEREARSMDIESIKKDLEAGILEVPSLEDEEGRTTFDFVISDIHLREYHHENTDDLLRFIWMVKHLNGRLILAGDTFDVWGAGGLEKCWTANTRIVNALTRLKEVVIVAGNHDEFLGRLASQGGIFANPRLKVVEKYAYPDGKAKVFHGHQFDRFNRPGSWIGRVVTRAIALLFFFAPKISESIILLPKVFSKIFLPAEYILNREVKNIMKWLASETADLKLSKKKPIYFIIGHIHYEGVSFLVQKLVAAVENKYGGRVKLLVTDSWTNGQGYIGDYVVLAQPGNDERKVIKRVWWQDKELLYWPEDLRG